MLRERTTTIVRNYWTTHLGCSVADFSRDAPIVISHSTELADSRGIFAFFIDAAPVISVPADMQKTLSAYFANQLVDDVASPTRFAASVRSLPGTIIGPAFIGYADEGTLRQTAGKARLLVSSDERAASELAASCSSLDWEHGGSIVGEQPTSGVFVGDRLVALAGYEIWGGSIAHIAVVTDPDCRGRGFARSAVSEITRHALQAGLIPQYRTLMSNTASIRVADALGFQYFGASVVVRID
jgi:RimJ/RimL family protein N-acetyltransferase